ncbi:MAG: hypothetical protein QG671_3847, partial [Actinomycetota bacterium]|nr:hypothetical protein [Actinomycetota bacterium]
PIKPSASAAPLPAPIKPSASAAPLPLPIPGTGSPSPTPSATPIPLPIEPPVATIGPKPKPMPTVSAVPLPQPITPERPTTLPALLDCNFRPETFTADAAATYKVTFAARWCPTYDDIRANKARNNIMESLQNLGPDTNYGSGDPVAVPQEDAAPQSACTPFSDWLFQLGSGIDGRTPGTNLSKVSNPGPTVSTVASVPELDAAGKPTGRSIAGAITLTLSQAQVDAASKRQLWIQGGTAGDPLGQASFPGQFGFGALRCANDNVNGDNVEYVNFTSSQRHVFCYYYAVRPPPKAGIIVIKKALSGISSSDVVFNFGGNTSYNPGGAFSLKGGQSIEFVRGATADTGFKWRVTETVPDGWRLAVTCDKQGASQTEFVGTNGVDISLVSGDKVTCTFTNAPNPPPNTLEIGKFADGADGTFGYDVRAPSSAQLGSGTVTVKDQRIGSMGKYDVTEPGLYKVTETLPNPANGEWALTAVKCQGAVGTVVNARTASIEVTSLNARSGSYCVLVNTFTPNVGSITVRSQTVGGAGGESSYQVGLVDSPPGVPPLRNQQADNTAANTFVTASPVTAADDTSTLDPGAYRIAAFGPTATSAGAWLLTAATCAGGTVGLTDRATGQVTVTLPVRGKVVCDFTWTLSIPSTIQLTKAAVVSGGSRNDNVVIVGQCTDGSIAALNVKPGDPLPASLPTPMTFDASTACTFIETNAGGNPADTTWSVTGPSGTTTGTGTSTVVRVDHASFPGAAYSVTFTNTYRAGVATPAPSPTPNPTVTGTPTPEASVSASPDESEDDRRPQLPVKPPALPETINPEGPTVIWPEQVPTNAGRVIKVVTYCTPRLSLNRAITSVIVPRGDVSVCVVRRDRSGRLTLDVQYPGPIRVFVLLAAPGDAQYKPYVFVKTWVTKP